MIKNINGNDFVFLPCHKVIQPIGALYVGALSWQIVRKIAYVNPRIFLGYDDNGQEVYSGIQRSLSKDRQKDIANYVNDPNATFPTAILLNIPIEKVLTVPLEVNSDINLSNIEIDTINRDFSTIIGKDLFIDTNLVWLIFPLKEGIAQIIDGQHRMSGFENANDNLEFHLPVTFTLNQDISEQAEMFAVINGKQTRVTPSLVYELFGISHQRSPYTVASKIVKLLNESNQSPLKQSIKILGKANTLYTGAVTQSTVAKIIIGLICGDTKQAEEDKRLLRKKEPLSEMPTMTKKKAVLRRYFIREQDEIIFKVLINFFNAVRENYFVEWNKPDTVLKKTIGFTALTRIMSNIIEVGLQEGDLSSNFFEEKLGPAYNKDFSAIQLSSKGIKQLVDLFEQTK